MDAKQNKPQRQGRRRQSVRPSEQREKNQRAQIRRLRMQQQANQDGSEHWGKKGLPMWARTLIAVSVVLLLILVFFRVDKIEVSGNVHYTPEEVADASGITLGDVLMGVNKTRAASRILVKLPYIQQVEVAKVLPGTVRFNIVECEAVAAAESEFGVCWLFNRDGKLLEALENEEETAYPLIQGTVLVLPNAGDPVVYEDTERGAQATEILNEILNAGLQEQIGLIDVTDESQIILSYDDRIEVRIGDITDVGYKLQYMILAMEKLGTDARGMLDLSFSEGPQAFFHPLAA